ncbi:hypothetical protein C7M61_001105 [Candidozyma pseudohaemuli]|uniref:UBX domain-containing protein n=1 Tax=Candidozyma pseudohaemuli TaxID=418784 RepID=A0A2P7YZN2_9ASCO|nr:hypothetical protein C7M61_001105 [[Candida] pseudohaemulonii]PSK41423.1 hypothetical protein C7M61_001105 [[Candida] pseudohaemulonii]
MDSLTDEQKSVLDEFVAITNVSLEDEDKAEKSVILLQNHSFNLNNAVLSFFESGLDNVQRNPTPIEEPTPLDSLASGFERFESNAVHRNLHDEFVLDHLLPKLPKAPKISNHWQFDLGIHMSRRALAVSEKTEAESPAVVQKKPSILWIILLIIPRAFSMLFSFLKFMLGWNSSPLYKALPSLFNWDTYDETYDITSIAEGINPTELHLRTTDFNKCHEESQKDFKFLTTILVDDSCVEFARQFLQSPHLKLLLEECPDNEIYLANVDKSPEAFEVAQTYKIRRLPYVMLVGNVTRNPQVMSSMSIIFKSNILFDIDDEQQQVVNKVLRSLKKSVNHFNPQLVSKRYDKQEMELSRLLKEKQDEAYLESLAQDREKKQEKQRKEAEESLKKELEQMRKNFIQTLVEKAWFEEQAQEATPKDLIRVSFKIPDGRRVIQKFPKSMPVVALYLFVETQLSQREENEAYEESELTIEEFCEKFDFNFELFKPFPKVNLPCEQQTIEEFNGLKLGDNIMVEYLGESEDEDEA